MNKTLSSGVLLVSALFLLTLQTSFAGQIGSGGVKRIVDNGRINGDPSYKIECNSGGSRIVKRKNNKWTNSLGATFSNRTWNLTLSDFAKVMCG